MSRVPMPGKVHELRALLQRCIDEWPEFDLPDLPPEEESSVNGGDLVEWFALWRAQVLEALEVRPLTEYEARVRVLEWREGMTTSDAQGVIDAEDLQR